MDAQTRIANAIAALNALEAGDFPTVLDTASQSAYEAFAELELAHHPAVPGPVWYAIGRALAKASDAIAPVVILNR